MPSLDELYRLHRYKMNLRIPPELKPSGGAIKSLTITMKPARAKVHPLVPATDFWSYNGSVPGPTIVASGASKVRVTYRNRIDTGYPFEAVKGARMNSPGSKNALPSIEGLADVKAWCVVHLHGVPAHPDSDGWTDNMDPYGHECEKRYDFSTPVFQARNRKLRGGRAPTYWYHDHGMGFTRFNVYAGLAGAWLVRDPIESRLGLPTNLDEVVLIIQDRNFETDTKAADGNLTGRLLHKITNVMETFPPATLVNGCLWPKHAVRPRLGRLRIINGSNARAYRLHFLGKKNENVAHELLDPKYVQQIGTDQGLLGKARDLTTVNRAPTKHCLVLAPGERADLLVDFGGLARAGYTFIDVYNSANAPFDTAAEEYMPQEVTKPVVDKFRKYPAVMRFTIKPGTQVAKNIRGKILDPDYSNISHNDLPQHDDPKPHGHSLIVLREEKGVLFMHEMMQEAEAKKMHMNLFKAGSGMKLLIDEPDPETGVIKTSTYVTVAKGFNDMRSIMIGVDRWHVFKVLNLSPDTHPFHIHLVQFQCIKRESFNCPIDFGRRRVFDLSGAVTKSHEIEKGWKDTLRVNPGDRNPATEAYVNVEMYSIAAQFVGHAGQYMYHCHILEHEDNDMMRPFVVVPDHLANGHGHGM